MVNRILLVTIGIFLALATSAEAGTARFEICPTGLTDASNIPMIAGIAPTTELSTYLSPATPSSTFGLASRSTPSPQWIWRNFEIAPSSTVQGAYPGMTAREALNTVERDPIQSYDFGTACLGPDPNRSSSPGTGGDPSTLGRNGLEISANVHSANNVTDTLSGRWVFRAPVGDPNNNQSVGISNFQGNFSWNTPNETGNGFYPVSALYNPDSNNSGAVREDLYCMLGRRVWTANNDWYRPLQLTFNKGAAGRGNAVDDGSSGCTGFGTAAAPTATGTATRSIGATKPDASNRLRKIWYGEIRCGRAGGCLNNTNPANNRRLTINNIKITVEDNESPGYFLNTSSDTISGQPNLASTPAGASVWKRGTGYLNFSYGDSGLGLDEVRLDNRLPNSTSDVLNRGQRCTQWNSADRTQGQYRLNRPLEANRYDPSKVADTQTGVCEAWYEYRRTGINTAQWPDGRINLSSLAYDYSLTDETRNFSWDFLPIWVDNTAPGNTGMTLTSAGTAVSADNRYVRGNLAISASGQEPASSTASGLRALYVLALQSNNSFAQSAISNLKTAMVPGTDPALDDFYAALYQFPNCQPADPATPLVRVSGCAYDTTQSPDGQELTVLLRATDNANNAVTVDTGNVIIDNTRPTISTSAGTGLGADNTTYAKAAVTIPIQVQDPVSGVAAVDYCISDQAGACSTWTTVSPESVGATSFSPQITVSSTSFLNLRARDRAGNSYANNQIVTVPVRIDSSPPTLEIEGDYSAWTNDSGLAARVFKGRDPNGGIEKVSWRYVSGQQAGDPAAACRPQEQGGCGFQYSLISAPIEYQLSESFAGISSGQRVIEATVEDRAGNTASAETTLKLDFVAPTVGAVSAEQSGSGRQTLSATVSDALSGPGTADFEICTMSDQCPSLEGTAWTPLSQTSATWAQCQEGLNGGTESATEKSYSCQLRVNEVDMPVGKDRIYIRLRGRDLAGNETTGPGTTSISGPTACPVVS